MFENQYNHDMREVVYLVSPSLWKHGHGAGHPLRPERLQRTYELLEEFGCLEAPNVQVITPRLAEEDELALFHTREYIAAVRALSQGDYSVPAARFNFGTGDNPVFEGMYDDGRLKVGGAMVGAEMLVAEACDVAFSYSGGMHHAGPDYASGFCVFNDAVVAIEWLVQQGMRIAYVDIDVHHGDGVQAAFYHTDRVLTISLHQDGRTLFPGTGFVREVGEQGGKGYSVNVPLSPYTFDEAYTWAFQEIVPPLLQRFEADIVVTQLGVDTHFLDPLANILLTTSGQRVLFETLSDFAPRWLALGGGGYNLDVVPRAWALAFSVMAGLSLPDELPPHYRNNYGGKWLHDQEAPHLGESQRQIIMEQVISVVDEVKVHHGID
jgi:acetoin utilization protein AcuC